MKPVYFKTAAEFRAWLEQNHTRVAELWVGFYKKSSGKSGITYEEAVDEALCFGWIDGIIRSLGAESYMHRFSPRRPGSIWSTINVGHVKRLKATGRMHAAGLAAFTARKAAKTGIYSFEAKRPAKLTPSFERLFRANRKAWEFFNAQPPGYKRLSIHRVVTPKQEATRLRWLDRLIAASTAGKRLDPLTGKPKSPRD